MPEERLLACPACGHTTFDGSIVGGAALLSCSRCQREYTLDALLRAARARGSDPIERETDDLDSR
jgi:DNA-directed RNA polymerase subunit RPC12/RpoP